MVLLKNRSHCAAFIYAPKWSVSEQPTAQLTSRRGEQWIPPKHACTRVDASSPQEIRHNISVAHFSCMQLHHM